MTKLNEVSSHDLKAAVLKSIAARLHRPALRLLHLTWHIGTPVDTYPCSSFIKISYADNGAIVSFPSVDPPHTVEAWECHIHSFYDWSQFAKWYHEHVLGSISSNDLLLSVEDRLSIAYLLLYAEQTYPRFPFLKNFMNAIMGN